MSKKKDPLVILLDIVIVIMVFVIIGVGINLLVDINFAKTATSFRQDSNIMSFELENNDYATLIQGKYINTFNNDNSSKSYHMLADYVEATSKYKVYINKGYIDKAREQKTIMENAYNEMGSLTIFADRANLMFGIEK